MNEVNKKVKKKMGRPLKFNEKSKILTIRVPESRFNEIKKKIEENLIEYKKLEVKKEK